MSVSPHPTKGPGFWYIIHRPDGKKREYLLFEGSEAEARAFDKDIRGVQQDVTYPTILDLLPRFLPQYQNNSRPGTYNDLQYALKRLIPHFGAMRIPLLLPHHFETYKTKRLADTYLPGKPGQLPEDDTEEERAKRKHVGKLTINRELKYLNAILSHAAEQGVVVGSRPKLFPKKQAEGEGRATIPLAPEEIGLVMANLEGDKRILGMLMFLAGLRKTEAFTLRCENIDLANGIMQVRGKGGAIQPVPILDDLRAELTAIKGQRREGYLVTNPKTGKPYSSIMKSLRTACAKAGCGKHIFHHLLRHTAGTCMMISGTQQRAIQGMLRHADIKTTSIYTHLASPFIRDEASKMSGLISPRGKP